MAYLVGLSGGIGSGKTAVSDRLAALGATVVDADVIAREVVEPGTPALMQIHGYFGAGILQDDGSLDRAALRQRVFADAEAKRWLEGLLHPLIGERTMQAIAEAPGAVVLLVSPLLVESGMHAICDRVLVVDVPEAVQIARTMQRDSNSREQVEAIVASQASREARLAKADDVLENTGTLAELHAKVDALYARYQKLAAEKTAKASSRPQA